MYWTGYLEKVNGSDVPPKHMTRVEMATVLKGLIAEQKNVLLIVFVTIIAVVVGSYISTR